jgi:polar amino acid transport system substrate-binding protein
MTVASRRPAPTWVAALAGVLALGVSACAPDDNNDSSSGTSPTQSSGGGTTAAGNRCSVDKLHLIKPATLTIATDQPAYEPWFSDNDPTNGKGFESAVAYAVAKQLGFAKKEVRWVVEPFNKSFAPGQKDFDFDINQISITPARAKVVDFSTGYYKAAQAVVVLNKSKYADATSLAALKGAHIGAQIGTTSLLAAQDDIKPTSQVAVFDDTNAAKQALLNSQVDAIVADLPTAFYITAAEIPGSKILGQFQSTTGQPEEFGMLFQKDNPLVGCVDKAIGALKRDGTLHGIEKQWLSSDVHVPELS